MAASSSAVRRTPWWHAYVATFAILVLIDAALRAWSPHPLRLPEQFSAGYLSRYVADLRRVHDPIVVMGDSALWGYDIGAVQAAPSVLARTLVGQNIINLAYEGGSPVNTEELLRFLLRNGVRPRLLVFNVNQKQFNPFNSAYRRLRPAVQLAAAYGMTAADLADLEFDDRTGINTRLNDLAERVWALYGYRVDLREALFGTDDFASFLTRLAGGLSGYTARKARADAPTPERFSGTYDLTPLDASNLSYKHLIALATLLEREHIPAIAVLTPSNHALLHAYIDNPDYRSNLAVVRRVLERHGLTVMNLDAAIPTAEFIDSDHMTPRGSVHFAELLQPAIERAIR